ncbi:reverse transcriptase domain-containing protein [Tanacetum coccineum]|uniref:Reverse transcriptase domain-containing protein n=1 Tax=Tanacetum coccineum TaxID=301880 RepID=A0ABQ5IZ92_9ASTR
MHTRASNSELVEPLPEPERTLNRRLHRRNRRVPFEQRNEPPAQPKVVYAPILDINYFHHFLNILENYNPMDDEPMWTADCVVAPTDSAITIPETASEFAIKGNHLTLVKGNQFDGRIKTDPHKHIHEFLEICDMFKYRDTENEVVLLMMFPLSLMGEAKIWLDELNEGTIETWDELRTAFIRRFFPLALFDRLLAEIRAFSQHEKETLTEAWLRIKEVLRNCHGHNLSKDKVLLKLEQISSALFSDESFAMIQNKVLLKLRDPGSFLIPCNFSKAFSCNALADLGASINLMPYSLYAKLSYEILKPTKMSVRLDDRSFQHPIGIAENAH